MFGDIQREVDRAKKERLEGPVQKAKTRRQFFRTLRGNTKIEVQQLNPKTGRQNRERFEKYKHAKTVEEYRKCTSRGQDLRFDLLHGYAWFTGENAEKLMAEIM